MAKQALISVSDKSGLEPLLDYLSLAKYEIVSTGGTAAYIREKGFQVKEVSELTKFPEMLGGRVKTLHPKVLGGVLARRGLKEDIKDLADHEIETIDLVVVNLYPFADVISRENLVFADAIENIDIGGPTLIRSAAKNYQSVTVLSDPSDYGAFINLSQEFGPDSSELIEFRSRQAIKAFAQVSSYDKLIAKFLESRIISQEEKQEVPKEINLNLELKQKTRYGENPHQKAGLYVDADKAPEGLAAAQQMQGKELSFNNYLDLDAAWNIVSEYETNIPCCVIVKHNNPCGVAIAPNVAQSFIEALSCDTVSAFGGIVAFNSTVDVATANEITQMFLEAVIAPDFTDEALEILATKSKLRVLKMPSKPDLKDEEFEIKTINGGYLMQSKNNFLMDSEQLKTVTKTEADESLWVDLIFAWKIVKHVKSNAIVVASAGKAVGVGCGQTNRVKAVKDALENIDMDSRGAVLASDGFFPFADNVDLCALNNIAAIIQPGGSIRDNEVIEAADKAGIAMLTTGTRHFKH